MMIFPEFTKGGDRDNQTSGWNPVVAGDCNSKQPNNLTFATTTTVVGERAPDMREHEAR